MRSARTGRHRAKSGRPSVPTLAALTAAVLATGQASASAAADDKPVPKVAPKMLQVFQKNLNFHPTEILIHQGDSVTWTNKESDETTHSVVQGNGTDINSPDIEPGQIFVWKFDNAGQWDIICRFHPDMFMTVDVADKNGKVPPSPPMVPVTPSLPANPTPPQGDVPGVTGVPVAHHRIHRIS
jgi:plastocyanin